MARACTVDGCRRPHKGHGYCQMHKARVLKYGNPGGVEPLRLKRSSPPLVPEPGTLHDTELCAWWVEPCELASHTQDLCYRHYNRSINVGVRVPRFRIYRTFDRHELSDCDESEGIATCQVCGPGARFEWRATGGRGAGRGRICIHSRSADQRRYTTGWSEREYDEAVIAQGNRCHLCGLPPNGRHGTLHADHDHAALSRRRLLCATCNQMLGLSYDDAALLRRAADYLEDHANPS